MNSSNRERNTIRPLTFQANFINNPAGSCLAKMGNTWVLATASVEEKVPYFMAKEGKGWITAEYSMLPGSTHTRSRRDGRNGNVSGRTMEIQRLIGRSLRACIDDKVLGERTLHIDCDVLQADGGTRVNSINAGFVAMSIAIKKLMASGKVKENPIKHQIAALSMGIKEDLVYADLDYALDSTCDVDLNVVSMSNGELVEIQGTAERGTFSLSQANEMIEAAHIHIEGIFKMQKEAIEAA